MMKVNKRTGQCEDAVRFRHGLGSIRRAVGRWAMGSREGGMLRELAIAHLIAKNIGETVPCPVGYDRTGWTRILDEIVANHKWNKRCSDCRAFFNGDRALQCTIGLDNPVKGCRCPECGSVVHEEVDRG